MTKQNVAFIDLETTGLDVKEHEIIEVGCVVVTPDLQEVVAEYDRLVLPLHPETGTREAAEINGYRPEIWDVWGVDLDTALTGLATVIDGCVLAGKQVDFDVSFLRVAYASAGRPWPAHACAGRCMRAGWWRA